MAKSKEDKSQKKDEKKVAKKAIRKRQRPEVQVVTCGFAFPISTKPRAPAADNSEWSDGKKKKKKDKLLDFRDVALEIRHYGAKALEGKSKRAYQDEEFEKLTGRKKKKHSVPLPIVRGIRKKAAEREAREQQEAREAGLVLPKKKKIKEKRQDAATRRVHGPAPSIGFMKKGMLSVKGKY